MGKKIVDKNCKRCNGLMKNVPISKLFCDDCKKLNRKDSVNRYNAKLPPKYLPKEYEVNFIKVITNNPPFSLTTLGFNEVSEIPYQSYRTSLKKEWCEIVKMYGYIDNLYTYIISEYKKFNLQTGLQNFHGFCNSHKYIRYDMAKWFTVDKIMADCGLRKQLHSQIDYEENLYGIIKTLGRLPLYNEFEEMSSITMSAYFNLYKLKGRKQYDRLLKIFSTGNQFNEYQENRLQHKSKVGKITGALCSTLTLEDLEREFKRVFDEVSTTSNEYPSRKLFNKLSKHDDSVYRKRLNMNWTEVCKQYGYKLNNNKNKFEVYVLNSIANILDTPFTPQKTFEWLKGINNYPLFCDGYFEEYNLVVEADGIHHKKPVKQFGGYKRFEINQQNDRLKDKLLKENGIKIIRIDIESDWHDSEYLKVKLIEHGISQGMFC